MQNYNSKFKIENYDNDKLMIRPSGDKEELELYEDLHGSYILNSKDLCLIKHLDKLVKAGVSSFKIEGRTKSDYYVGLVTGAYRKALETVVDKGLKKIQKRKIINYLHKELEEKTYHRGFTTGFLFDEGRFAQNLNKSHIIPNWEFCGQIMRSKKVEVRSKKIDSPLERGGRAQARPERVMLCNTKLKINNKYLVYIKIHNSLFAGDNIEIIMPYYDIIRLKIRKTVDAKTGEEIKEAHGGKGQIVMIESEVEIPEYSLVRRKLEVRIKK